MSIYHQARARTETRLINAAITCLLRDGYARLTVTAIAAEADVGRGTFYAYFTDVDDVLLAISRRYFFQLQQEIHTMMLHYASPEKEQRAWQAAFDQAVQLQPLMLALTHPQAVTLAQRFQVVMIDGFRESLATDSFLYPRWMNLPLDIMATFTAGAVMAVMRQWIAGELPYSAAEMGAMVYQLLYHPGEASAQHPDP